MKLGVHKEALVNSLAEADNVYCFESADINWSIQALFAEQGKAVDISNDIETLCTKLVDLAEPNDHILIMSNGGFGNIHQKLLGKLGAKV